MDKLEKIEGVVERIVYHSPDSGYTVAVVKCEDMPDNFTVVGKIASIKPGHCGTFEGEWTDHKTYGRQFKVASYNETQPSTVTGILKYLGSGMIKGIGKEYAARLVSKFGEKTLEVIEKTPEKLLQIDGIGAKRLDMILSAWNEQREIRDVMIFLQGYGLGPQMSVKIYKHYGRSCIDLIKKNPYQLASEIVGIGFKIADRIAKNMGFSVDSPFRAESAVIHILSEGAEEGHCYLPMGEIMKKCTDKLIVPEDAVQKAIESLYQSNKIIKSEDMIYLSWFHHCEENAAKILSDILKAPKGVIVESPQSYIESAQNNMEIILSDGQKDALYTALKNKVSIITGGPGVGKTTILKTLVEIINSCGHKFSLCAPTGRAAKRMTETIGHEAKTIHRLLKFKPGDNKFEFSRKNKLNFDWVIIDEMSMVDISLFYSLLSALNPATRIVMIGDSDQLPSVGAGSVLSDLINSGIIPVAHLNDIYRQKKGSLIIDNAHRINKGEFPVAAKGKTDFYFISSDDPDEVSEIILNMVTKRIPSGFGLNPSNDIQVLTPMHRNKLGSEILNSDLQKLLNPNGKPAMGFKIGDKVMQIRNNYDKEIFNGDIGKVTDTDDEGKTLTVDFDGKIAEYEFSELDELKMAYACTVHKSQGSEFPAVVMPLYTGHFVLLQRNLLYTAITRAKKLVVLVGSKKALAVAIKNANIKERYTGFREKLIKILTPEAFLLESKEI